MNPAQLKATVDFSMPDGVFIDPLIRDPNAKTTKAKFPEFFEKGGMVIEAPEQETVSGWVESGAKPWSIGIHPTDYLIPVCHQGMNRSQVMRLVLTDVREQLGDEGGVDTEWVSRAHGAVSGCDAHSAWEKGTLTEDNFITYMFDTGEIFEPGYDPEADTDEQSGPLQRGFVGAFGVNKKPRFGEEMARGKKLNPVTEYVPPREWLEIGEARESTHKWFDKFMFAPITHIRQSVSALTRERLAELHVGQNMIPPAGATRRIFFAFCRAVPNLVDRLLEVEGGPLNTVIVSLQYDDSMNSELRYLGGKTEQQVQDKMAEVHQKAYQMYAKLVHADPRRGPDPVSEVVGKNFSSMSLEQLQSELKTFELNRNTIRDLGVDITQIQADIDKIQEEIRKR